MAVKSSPSVWNNGRIFVRQTPARLPARSPWHTARASRMRRVDHFTISPPLHIPWAYDDAREPWKCTAVWVHSATHPNGQVYTHGLRSDVKAAMNHLARRIATCDLLVDEDGVYDRTRLGFDHNIALSWGRRLTLSVRRHPTPSESMVLLAVVWN